MQIAAMPTAEEFHHLPDPTEGRKMELVRGKVVTISPTERPHSTTARRIDHALTPFVEAHDLGEWRTFFDAEHGVFGIRQARRLREDHVR